MSKVVINFYCDSGVWNSIIILAFFETCHEILNDILFTTSLHFDTITVDSNKTFTTANTNELVPIPYGTNARIIFRTLWVIHNCGVEYQICSVHARFELHVQIGIVTHVKLSEVTKIATCMSRIG